MRKGKGATLWLAGHLNGSLTNCKVAPHHTKASLWKTNSISKFHNRGNNNLKRRKLLIVRPTLPLTIICLLEKICAEKFRF